MRLDECYQAHKKRIDALDARVLMCHALGLTPEEFLLHKARVLDAAQIQSIDTLVALRATGMPVAKIIGKKYFYDLEFLTTTDTLDPRPDSETVIDAVLKKTADRSVSSILDLGTGTGCLVLTLLHHRADARGVAVDQSAAALRVAQQNAENLGLLARVTFQQGCWFDTVTGLFDVVVSNPPYIPTADIATLARDVRDFDPHCALDGGADGLDPYRVILADAGRFMAPGGLLAFELGLNQAQTVAAMTTSAGFQNVEIHHDLAGIGRVVTGFWL
jgi:release factor glutamine methyltransferase